MPQSSARYLLHYYIICIIFCIKNYIEHFPWNGAVVLSVANGKVWDVSVYITFGIPRQSVQKHVANAICSFCSLT